MRENKLPAGWVWTTLGEIAISVSTANEVDTEGEFVYIDIGSIDNTVFEIPEPKSYTWANAPSRARQIVKTGDILFSTVRTYLKNIAQVPAEFDNQVASTGFCVIRPVENLIDHRFVFFYILSNQFLEPLNTLQIGAVYPTVKDKDVFNQPFPLPPLADQIRIAKLLDRLMEQLRSAQAALAEVPGLLRLFRQKVLSLGMRGELTREWRKYNNLEFEWEIGTLAYYGIQISSGKSFICIERPPRHDEIGVLKVSAITGEWFDEMESKTCYTSENINEQLFVKPGDFLFCRANSLELVGACVIVKSVDLKLMLSDKTLRFKFNQETNPSFLLYFLKSKQGRSEIERLATRNHASMKNISQGNIRQISTPIVSLIEQNEVVAQVEKYLTLSDQLESDYEAAKSQLDNLSQSLLSKAFRGELCPPEPSAENAEILLARIRKEKARLEILKKEQRSQRQARKMKSEKKLELKALADVLEASKREWIPARMAWQKSEHRDDIEGFYAELKRLIETEQTVEEEKRGKESYLRMTQA